MGNRAWLFGSWIAAAVLAGCSSSTPATGGDGGTDDGGGGAAAATSWTVSGVLTAPANETATNLKLVATTNVIGYSASTYASDALPLTLTGSPPSTNFSLLIDTTKLGTLSGPANFGLVVFQDTNGDGVNNASEGWKSAYPTDPSCALWCDGTSCTSGGASFQLIPAGSGGTGANGSYSIDTTGWYYLHACNDWSCALLITQANSQLDGVKIAYGIAIAP